MSAARTASGGRRYEPKSILDGDPDVRYFADELYLAAYRIEKVGTYPNDDTIRVCNVCEDVDGHLEGCPIGILGTILTLTQEEEVARKKAKTPPTDAGKGR